MATLTELLGGPAKRGALIEDSLRVLDAEVDSKGGLSGLALKAAFKLIKGISPEFLRGTVDHLLPEFLQALDPVYQEAVQRSVDPKQHLTSNPGRVADALLAITDGKANRSKNQVVKKTYERLRESAKKHVEAAVPRLGEMFARHIGS